MTDHQPTAQGGAQPHPTAESTEWCMGLSLVEDRALHPGEIEQLNGEAARLFTKGCLMGCGSPLVFLVPIIGLASLDQGLINSPSFQAPMVIIMVFTLAAIAFFMLKARDALKRAKGLRRDTKAAYIKRFAGNVSQYQALLPTQYTGHAQTAKATVGAEEPTQQLQIEVLPCTRRLWKRDGEIVEQWTDVSWSEVARTPQFASMAAAWVEPLRAPSHDANVPQILDSNQHGQRDLSPAEKTELQRRARQAWLRPFWPAFFLSLWLAIPLSFQILSAKPLLMEPQAFLLIFVTGFAYYSLVQGLMTAWSLRKDVEIGIAVILRVPASLLHGFLNTPVPPIPPPQADAETVAGAADQPTSSPQEANTVVEILPFSRLDWTENGKPAAWRKIPGN